MTVTIYATDSISTGRTSTTDNWATIRGATTANDTQTAATRIVQTRYASGIPIRGIYRAFFNFSLASIPSGAKVTSASLQLYGSAKGTTETRSFRIYNSSHGDTLDANTYNDGGTTQYSDDAFTISAWSTTGYNTFNFNSTGITALESSVGSTFRLCLREHTYDVGNTQPPDSTSANPYISFYSEDETGTDKGCKLVISYIAPAGMFLVF